MERPELNGLLEVIRVGDVLVVTALDRLRRDTLGLLELINRLATMGVDLRCWICRWTPRTWPEAASWSLW